MCVLNFSQNFLRERKIPSINNFLTTHDVCVSTQLIEFKSFQDFFHKALQIVQSLYFLNLERYKYLIPYHPLRQRLSPTLCSSQRISIMWVSSLPALFILNMENCCIWSLILCINFERYVQHWLAGWQNLAAFRRKQKWQRKFSSSAYLQFSRQMRRFCA